MVHQLLRLLGAPLDDLAARPPAERSCEDDAAEQLSPAAADLLLNPAWTSAAIGAPATAAAAFHASERSPPAAGTLPLQLLAACAWPAHPTSCAGRTGRAQHVPLPVPDWLRLGPLTLDGAQPSLAHPFQHLSMSWFQVAAPAARSVCCAVPAWSELRRVLGSRLRGALQCNVNRTWLSKMAELTASSSGDMTTRPRSALPVSASERFITASRPLYLHSHAKRSRLNRTNMHAEACLTDNAVRWRLQ